MNDSSQANWSTDQFAERDRFEAWLEQLNATYLDWSVDDLGSPKYNASVASRSFDGFTFIDCRCDPFSASRRATNMARDTREILGIQLVVDGRETVKIGNEEVHLAAGDIMVWDNTRPLTFAVHEPLRKLSILIPLDRFKNWLPTSWYTIDKKIAKASPASRLLSSFMLSLPDYVFDRSATNGNALLEASIGLLVDASQSHQGCNMEVSLKEAQLVRVYNIIDQHLTEDDLSPHKIASMAKISVRYLHWLFQLQDCTVTKYIIKQRLLRCRRDLANPAMVMRTITDISFSCGFQNMAHFSRSFKEEFGVCPTEYRMQMVLDSASSTLV